MNSHLLFLVVVLLFLNPEPCEDSIKQAKQYLLSTL